jgi:hypothetical protein
MLFALQRDSVMNRFRETGVATLHRVLKAVMQPLGCAGVEVSLVSDVRPSAIDWRLPTDD